MVKRWFYSSQGQTHGPLAPQDIQARARLGELSPGDLVWPEGADRADAIPAEQAIDFPALSQPVAPAAPANLPDWLADVQVEPSGPKTAPAPQPAASATEPAVPDWLNDLRQQPPARPVFSVPPSAPALGDKGLAPLELAEALPPTPPEPPFDVELTEEEAEALALEILTDAPPLAQPVAAENKGPDMEVAWRRARTALERWIDLDVNHDAILAGDLQSLHSDVVVREIIYPLNKFGPKLVDRMFQHLDFLAENRRKYYQALARKKKQSEPRT